MKICYAKLWNLSLNEGYTPTQLAKKANISTYSISKIKKNQSVQIEVLIKISEVFNCDLVDLIEIFPSSLEQ